MDSRLRGNDKKGSMFRLAFRAEVSAAAADDDTLDSAAAAGAFIADAVSDDEIIVGMAGLAAGADIIADTGAVVFNAL